MTRSQSVMEFQADEIHRQFIGEMSALQKAIAGCHEAAAMKAWQQTRQLVDALPLATDQYDRAVSRLNNCRRYLVSSEFGAAVYELKLLVGALELRKAAIQPPQRRSQRRQTPVVFQEVDETFERVLDAR